jgi:tetratricopeptide (TPR) repeat protein
VKRAVGGLLFLLLVCLAVAYGYLATSRERAYRDHIARGEAALAGDDIPAAIEAFSSALTVKPDSMLGYLRRGEAYRRQNDLDSALRDLRQAVELDQTSPRASELLGDVNYALGRFERAAERFQHSIGLDDRSARVQYKLALSRYRTGQVPAAVTALGAAITLDDKFAEAHYLLGLCYRDQQKHPESVASLQRSLALSPALIHAREELADLLGKLGRSEERIAELEALLYLDPAASRQVALGLAYARAGRPDLAVITLRRAAERYPQHPQTYVALGRVWLDAAQLRGDRVDLSKALEALGGAVASDRSSEALTLFGRALLTSGDDDAALRTLHQATENLPVDPSAFYFLAEVAERRGSNDVARRALLDYQALEGEGLDTRRRTSLALRIGDLSMRIGDLPTAIAFYQRAVAASSEAPALLRLAEAQMRARDAKGARATLARVLEKDPNNRTAKLLQLRLR